MTEQGSGHEARLQELADSGVSRRGFLKGAVALGVSAGFASSFLAACSSPSADPSASGSPTGSPKPGGTFREGYDRELTPPDPVQNAWADPTFNAFYEAMIIRNPEGSPVPMLASSYNSGPTGWDFTLRDGLKFHSGAAVTPDVVVTDFKLFANPKTGQNFPWWAPITAITSSGQVIKCATKSDYRAFQETITTEYAYILNPAAREKAGAQYGASVIDGTGPFKMDSFSPQSCVASRWEEYPGSITPFFQNKGKAYLDGIKWVPITQASQRANELESGNVDAVKNTPPQDVDRLKSNSDLVVVEFQELSNFFLSVNLGNTKLGFDDVKVRQAISAAIDRKALVDSIYLGHAAATYGPVPPGFKWYNPAVEPMNAYDTTKAAKLLDEAGWAMGSDGVRAKNGTRLSFTTLQMAESTEEKVMQAVVEMLKKVGIEMKVEALEGAAFFPKLTNTLDSYAFKWLWSGVVDVSALFVQFYQPTDAAGAKTTLAAYQPWVEAATEGQLKTAAENYQEVFAEQLALIPLVTPNTVWASNKKVIGWTPNQANLYPFYNDVWLAT
ncbi:MAG TPA: ABC transporter substrate-binding protein [Rhodoglobus sp.]|nr:ABC transporter substrate-binding protein [Rhodoglobus sp.]